MDFCLYNLSVLPIMSKMVPWNELKYNFFLQEKMALSTIRQLVDIEKVTNVRMRNNAHT